MSPFPSSHLAQHRTEQAKQSNVPHSVQHQRLEGLDTSRGWILPVHLDTESFRTAKWLLGVDNMQSV